MAFKRNYRKEYDRYQGKPNQIKRRASRNKARAIMARKGLVRKGDGKDVHHTTGNQMNNSKLSVNFTFTTEPVVPATPVLTISVAIPTPSNLLVKSLSL